MVRSYAKGPIDALRVAGVEFARLGTQITSGAAAHCLRCLLVTQDWPVNLLLLSTGVGTTLPVWSITDKHWWQYSHRSVEGKRWYSYVMLFYLYNYRGPAHYERAS